MLHYHIGTLISWSSADSMLIHASAALAFSEKTNFTKGIFYSYCLFASSRFITGEIGKGLSEAGKALDLARKSQNESWQAKALNTIGLLYLRTSNKKNAIAYFDDVVTIYQKTNNRTGLGTAYNNLANCYLELDDLRQSLAIRKKALAIREELKDELTIADTYNDLGETYMELNRNDSAEIYFEKCLAIKQRLNDDEMCAVAAMNIGRLYMKEKKYALSKEFYNKASQWSEKINSNIYRMDIANDLSEIAEAEGDNKSQVQLLKKLMALKDTVYNEANRKQINQLNAEFETERKELRIANQQKEIEKQNTEKIAFACGFALMLIAAFVSYRAYRQKQKTNKIIAEQKIKVEEKQKEMLDSIRYAQRIQKNILPTDKYIHKSLRRLRK